MQNLKNWANFLFLVFGGIFNFFEGIFAIFLAKSL
jgi:hypothetical protein